MLIVIVYSEQFTDNAKSLSGAIKERWAEAGVNLMGTFGKSNDFSKYQIQLGRDIIYISESVIDNGTAIDLIEERV